VTAQQSTPFWGPDFDALGRQDPEIAGVVLDELERLRGGLQLIASENLTSPAVLAALGSTLSNKYAEGYPGRRYYGGCQVVDRAELKPSGLRVGSPSVTTQGMTESDMAEVGSLLARAVRAAHGTPAGDAELAEVAAAVSALVARAPAYPRP
jgi:glycine/serine hydroxymethyltransferase